MPNAIIKINPMVLNNSAILAGTKIMNILMIVMGMEYK